MRVTPSILYRTALADLSLLRSEMAVTQEQASSGRRINRPSDDPAGAGASLRLQHDLATLDQLARNGGRARVRMEASETTVANVNDLFIRARELAVAGSTDSQDATSRRILAGEIESLHATLVAETNSVQSGGFLFSGFAGDVAPFSVAGAFLDTPPSSPVVTFVGDPNEILVEVEVGISLRVGFDGRRVFLGDSTGAGSPDPGREDLFDVLADLRDALMNDDRVATAAVLPRIDAALDQLSAERTTMGGEITRAEDSLARLAQRKVDGETALSLLRDADLAEVISSLARQEAALQVSLAGMARLLSPTLLDFLG